MTRHLSKDSTLLLCAAMIVMLLVAPVGAEPAVTVQLGTVAPVSARQGWGSLAINRSVMGKGLRIVGRQFATGLGTHADSEVLYDLDRSCDRFEAWVGVDAEMASYAPQPSVRFRVLADGKEVFNSGVMRVDTPAKRVSVSVRGVTALALIVDSAGDGNSCDHADWADAVITQSSAPQGSRSSSAPARYFVAAPGIRLGLTADGRIANATLRGIRGRIDLGGFTRLLGCVAQGKTSVRKLAGGGWEFGRKLRNETGDRCTLAERFIPTKSSVRWEIEIRGGGNPWSMPISTRLRWPVTQRTRFWTAWSDPDPLPSAGWHDPLVTRPMVSRSFAYGGTFDQNGAYITVPIATLIESERGLGLSLVMSPEDTTMDASLSTTSRGDISFTRVNNRISKARPVRFAMDVVPHEPDIRGGLGWMVNRYPQYFESPNPKAHEIAGCGAYSFYEGDLDAAKLKKMGFRVNWKASYDFPYMGMFLPPVANTQQWTPLAKRTSMSIDQMADYSKRMRQAGFYVLNYFNCNEIGIHLKWPAPERKAGPDEDLWKDANDFVYYALGKALLRSPGGGPVGSWEGCVVADPGDEAYHKHLVQQAKWQVEKLPESSGICIDRLDWMRSYNFLADDGVSWVDGKAARSLIVSWKGIASDIGRVMHAADKVVFVNPVYKRLDAMCDVDGIYDEFGHLGSCLNASTFMALRKPMIAWTSAEDNLRPDPDTFFQRHLYMGAFPTAPVPDNDHTINPSAFAEKWYLDYGPMLDALRGRKWVLKAGAVKITGGATKANIFKTPSGYVIPVVFGGNAKHAIVVLSHLAGVTEKGARFTCKALHPGTSDWETASFSRRGETMTLDVPLVRGCAIVRVAQAK